MNNKLRNYINKNIPKGLMIGVLLLFLSDNLAFSQNAKENNKIINNTSLVNPGLDYKLLQDTTQANIIKDRAERNSFINMSILKRDDFNQLNGNFLVESGGGEYNLYMPEDIIISELPAFIEAIDGLTKGKHKGSYSDFVSYIKNNISYLRGLEQKGQLTSDTEKLLLEFEILLSELKENNNYRYFDYGKDLEGVILLREEDLAIKIYEEFMESFVENGVESLSNKVCDQVGIDIDLEIERLNESNNIESELQILSDIVNKVYNYNGFSDVNIFDIDGILKGSSPKYIYDSDTIMCVGMGLVINNIFDRIGIKHKGIVFEDNFHTATVAELSDGSYFYVDPISSSTTYKIKSYEMRDNQISRKYNGNTYQAIIGKAEDIFISELYYNNHLNDDSNERKIYWLNEAIKKCENVPLYYRSLSLIYIDIFSEQKLNKYLELALVNIDKAISLDADNSNYRYIKSIIYKKMGDSEKQKLCYNKYAKLK